MVQAPARSSLRGVHLDLRCILGLHASGGLGELCARAVWHILHSGLVAGPGLRERSELCYVHAYLLSCPPHGHHRLFLRHDHRQGEVLSQGDLSLRHAE